MIRRLVSLQLRGLLSGMAGKAQGGKKRKIGNKLLIALLAAYVIGASLFALGAFFYMMMEALKPFGLAWFYHASAMLAAFAFSFIGSVFLSQSSLFSAKDNELLLAMPIRPQHILLARTVSLYLFTLAIQALVLLPAAAIHWYFNGFSLTSSLLMLVMNLLLPLPALALSILLGWLLAMVSSRIPRKNLVVILLSIAFMAAYFVGYSRLMAAMQDLLNRGQEMAAAVRAALPPAYQYGLAIAADNLGAFAMFALFCLLPFSAVMALVAANYNRVMITQRGTRKIRYKGGALKAGSPMKALTQKEMRRFFTSPVYLMNSGISLLFMLALPIYLLFDSTVLDTIIHGFNLPSNALPIAAVAVMGMLASSVFISAPSISLEGKAFWIPQSLPVSAFQSVLAKALAHIMICLPVALFSGILMGVLLELQQGFFALMIAFPLVMVVFTAFLGLVLNLRFPKMDWRNETEPVKQSLSTFLAMSLGFLSVAAAAALYIFFLANKIDEELYLLLCAVFFSLLAALMAWYLKKTAQAAYLRISEA